MTSPLWLVDLRARAQLCAFIIFEAACLAYGRVTR